MGYELFGDSREEANLVQDLYHNRHYTEAEKADLGNRGQPKETFNIVKLFARMLLGYYSTVVNTATVYPRNPRDVTTASVLNDLVSYTYRHNNFDSEGDKIKLDGILQGLMCSYVDVTNTGDKDEFGVDIKEININHVPASEIVLDPMSRLEDYSDARFIHRFKWMDKDQVLNLFGKKAVDKLDSYDNHLNIEEAEFTHTYNEQFQGQYKQFDNYLIVHSVIKEENGDTYTIFWSGEEILSKEKITYKEVKFPYRVHKVHNSNQTEYYGIFREVLETQKAINQALLKIQLMVNTQKAFVEEGSVESLADFTKQFNRVNAIIPVKDLAGIKVENLTREVLDQYTIIDKALDRVQRVLSINDSFLGMAYASDSGRKVKLQQNASVIALRYLTNKISQMYRLLAWDVANLIKQYYTAHQVVRISDKTSGDRWLEVNRPITYPTGRMAPNGLPEFDFKMEPKVNPEDNSFAKDKDGNYLMVPARESDTVINFTDFEIEIDSSAYNDEDEKNQLMLETILQGPIGNAMMNVNPAGYFKAASLSIKSVKTKHSLDIANILDETIGMLSPEKEALLQGQPGQVQGSPTMKLPQNTNEGF